VVPASLTMVAALLPLLTFGTLQCWPDWIAYLSALPPEKIPLRFGNMGLPRLLFEATELDLSLPLAAATLIAVMAGLWRGARPGLEDPPSAAVEDLAAVGAGCLIYLLSSPMVWLHYLLLALPAALVLLRPPPGGGGGSWRVALAVLALLGLAVDPATHAFGLRSPEGQAVLTSLSLLLLFGLLCAEMSRWTLPPADGGHTIATGGAS
jgi:hypothetical protein